MRDGGGPGCCMVVSEPRGGCAFSRVWLGNRTSDRFVVRFRFPLVEGALRRWSRAAMPTASADGFVRSGGDEESGYGMGELRRAQTPQLSSEGTVSARLAWAGVGMAPLEE